MIPLPLAWTLLTVLPGTAGSSQILLQEPTKVLYPKILSQEIIECGCLNISCDFVYWFHIKPGHSNVEFLAKCNSADRVNYGAGVNKDRFKFSKRTTMSFGLRIINVTEEDTGFYSCVLKDKNFDEIWRPGVLLRPGVTPPTVPPKTKTKPKRAKSFCHCPKKSRSQDGCGSLVLWPLVALTGGLALALICTLYYFSREDRRPKALHLQLDFTYDSNGRSASLQPTSSGV